MPTSWNRSPEEFHKTYIANTDAFYRLGNSGLAPELDKFVTQCALGLWSRSAGVTQEHVDMANMIYSKGQRSPSWMLWTLTSAVCETDIFMPPIFFWNLAESDAKRGTVASRTFIRMVTNILLYLAAADDDVTMDEARYITEVIDKLTAICDASGVGKGKEALNPMDYVTSTEASFLDKNPPAVQTASAGSTAAQNTAEEQAEKPNFDELMEQLESLVGLEEVKKDIKSLMNLVKVRQLRKQNDLPVAPMSLHMVFMGNPGTGKTTVARLMSGLLSAIGVLNKGQLVEVDRSGLVAGYVGQTALKTQEVIQSAIGGVLFIDEAYSLSSGGENDFGREAIETILKAMEDHRDELIVIVAGYSGPMQDFLSSNPGLESRFNKYFWFPDYTGEQLMKIFEGQCKKNGYTVDEEASALAAKFFQALYEERDENFGNARDVRNRFEDMVSRQANRLAQMEAPTREDLMALTMDDILDEEDRKLLEEAEETEE
ncbi:MAG: AAA family ATPase [Oscillospiraceae bacterium]|nr:AAA family ATPase [Oscillospiraceae bacterium]